MTAQQAILSLGTFTLAGCGGGLILVHDNNPLLKGLDWMGGALVIGGVSAALFLTCGVLPQVEPLANFCALLSFFCCYRADRYLLGLDVKIGRIGVVVLALQLIGMVFQWTHLFTVGSAVVTFSLVLALQIGNTARLIRKHATAKSRKASRVTVILMICVVGCLLVRAGVAACGVMDTPRAGMVNLITYDCFFGFGIALAFAFFWRTTTKLSGELQHMASTDPLTRVFNRRMFLQWCESEQARSERLHAPFSLLMVDFDHFKHINDTFGHHVGDQALCAAVERIQDSIRGIDVLCRWGGEEFAVLLPNASEEATLIVAERVRRNVSLVDLTEHFTEDVHQSLQLTASLGTATFDGEGDTFQNMLQRADKALYAAKRAGRNRVMQSGGARREVGFLAGHLSLHSR